MGIPPGGAPCRAFPNAFFEDESHVRSQNDWPDVDGGCDRGLPRDDVEFDDQDIDLVVATDVSFPVEIQSGDALADPLRKLNQLLEPGVLTEEEYAVAKAKLLS
jgi:hypothetical protein